MKRRLLNRTLMVGIALVGIPSCERAQQWSLDIERIETATVGWGAAAVVDGNRQQLLALHGREGKEVSIGSWHSLEFTEEEFKSIEPSNSPGPLFMPCCAIDRKQDRLYLFGGWPTTEDAPARGLWKLSLNEESKKWSQVRKTSPWPPARNGATLLYDEVGDSLLLFGGDGGVGEFSFTPLDDLWRYDLSTERWKRIATAGPTPPARWNHAMVIVQPTRRCYLFGGAGAGFDEDEYYDRSLYELNLADHRWTKLDPGDIRPPSVQGATLTYDVAERALVLAGGLRHEPPGAATCSDIWVFCLDDERWESLQGNKLTQRRDHVAGYDPAGKRHYLFGGHVSSEIGDFYKRGRPNSDVVRLRLRRRK